MRKISSALKLALAGLTLVWWSAGLVRGDANCGKGTASAGSQSSGDKSSTKKSTRDPVAQAFALPRGTQLSAKQQVAYDKLKRQYTSSLRSAIALIQSDNKGDTTKGLKQNKEVRAKIRAGIQQILAMQTARSGGYSSQGSGYGARPASGGSCPCGR